MEPIVLPLVIGVALGLVLSLISLGLVFTYGMMRIVNMADGAFFMLSAFLFATVLAQPWSQSPLGFVAAAVIPIAGVAVLGVILERLVYRRIYGRPHVSSFLAMFALMMCLQGMSDVVFGVQPLPVRAPLALATGSVMLLGVQVPYYHTLAIIVGVTVLGMTGLLVFRTQLGLWTRAIAADRQMAAVLGCKVQQTFSIMFAFGCILAGIAGVLVAPLQQVDSELGTRFVLQAFAVVLVGGIGSLRGALIAALSLGIVDTFFAIDVPMLSGYGVYLVMILVLFFRPSGIFKTANAALGTEHV
jgi:branched-subunit amino acid ABC-type transport system permease component